MCGIAAVFRLGTPTGGTDGLRDQRLHQLLNGVASRGLQSPETWSDAAAALGCARLPLVGGTAGAQPIVSHSGSVVAVANGEIFNHRELPWERQTASRSDCRVVVDGYLSGQAPTRWAGQLSGQFALVVYDSSSGTVTIGRDRFGICPLFWAVDGDYLGVASSAAALASAGFGAGTVDEDTLWDCVSSYGPRPPRSIYGDVHQVVPGEILQWVVSSGAGLPRVERFSDITAVPSSFDPADTAAGFHDLFRLAVRSRLPESGRTGVYVSGGVDSAAIAAAAREFVDPGSITAYSLEGGVTHSEPESRRQTAVTRALGIERRAVAFEPVDPDSVARVAARVDAPLLRTGPIGMCQLADLVRQDGTDIVLTGEGADELCFGYPYYSSGVSATKVKSSMLGGWADVLGLAPTRAETDAGAAELDLSLVTARTRAREEDVEHKLSRFLLGPQGDRAAMTRAVELRFPFLDDALWANEAYRHLGTDKRIIRDFLLPTMKPTIWDAKKSGFLAPAHVELGHVFRDPAAAIDAAIDSSRSLPYIDEVATASQLLGPTTGTELKIAVTMFVLSLDALERQLLGWRSQRRRLRGES